MMIVFIWVLGVRVIYLLLIWVVWVLFMLVDVMIDFMNVFCLWLFKSLLNVFRVCKLDWWDLFFMFVRNWGICIFKFFILSFWVIDGGFLVVFCYCLFFGICGVVIMECFFLMCNFFWKFFLCFKENGFKEFWCFFFVFYIII